MTKERLDAIVQRRLGVSLSKARGLIQTGMVTGPDGEMLRTAGIRLPEDVALQIEEGPRYVSRGGLKLEAALDAFPIEVAGAVAIDAGASTGGFTDCLLQRGAAQVYAVDVGYGQLAWRLRQDPRVAVLERTNIRHLQPGDLTAAPRLFCADCSFISLELVLPALARVLAPGGEGVALIKPQFEAARSEVGEGGVVRDPEVRERTVRRVLAAAARIGFVSLGVIPSPLTGPAGNREFLAHFRLARDGGAPSPSG